MNLLRISLARSIWLFPFEDLNPRGRYWLPIYDALIKRYNFASSPQSIEDVKPNEGVKVQFGVFEKSQKEQVSVDLTIHNDGMVADTRSSTRDSDAFLEDAFNWMATDFGLSSISKLIRRKTYVSELHVYMESSLNILNPKLEEFTKHLSSRVVGYESLSFETGGISFWADPTEAGITNPFSLERLEGEPFKENRYLSKAPLQTEDHLELLEELEKILSG